MKKTKGLLIMLFTAFIVLSCSIDRIDEIPHVAIQTMDTELVQVGDATYPWGGWWVYFYADGVEYNSIFLNNGADGTNGIDGINGLDGIDGEDGASVTITTEIVEDGTILTITQGDSVTEVFIPNGLNGSNGLDGLNGNDGADGLSVVITTEEIEGGTILTITQGEDVTKIFIENGIDGVDGVDGTNGINGLDGIDGEDGASVTITTEEIEGGTILTITQGDSVTEVFIPNGVNGTNGLDGLDGIDGEDGVLVTITYEIVEGGTILTITQGEDVTTVFIKDGKDGNDGNDGNDGQNSGGDTVTICHKVTHPVDEHPEWGSNTSVTLTYNLSEYIQHIYEFHNGNSSQNDTFGACN